MSGAGGASGAPQDPAASPGANADFGACHDLISLDNAICRVEALLVVYPDDEGLQIALDQLQAIEGKRWDGSSERHSSGGGPSAGGDQQGNDNAGGDQQGNDNAGGDQQGNDNIGGDPQGNDQQGNDNAGGDQRGHDNGGGHGNDHAGGGEQGNDQGNGNDNEGGNRQEALH